MTTPTPITPAFHHLWIPATNPDETRIFVLLHGTGGDENDLVPLARMVAPGAAVLSPRGKVVQQGMNRWFVRAPDGSYDIPDLIVRAEELSDFMIAAGESYGFNPRTATALGYSNGANLARGILALRPELFGDVILLRTGYPILEDHHPDLSGKRILMISGKVDPYYTGDVAEERAAHLRGCGADVTLILHPGGHELGERDVREVHGWLSEGYK